MRRLPRRSAKRVVGRLLVAAGTSALLLLLIVITTGGFTIRAGPLYFAAHRWRGPLVVAFIAFAAAASSGRAAFTDAAASTWRFVDEHALSLAIVIAAAAAGAGIACGTYSASSSDASGYISEAQLLSAARVAADEPLARAVAWPNATWAFAPLGYRPGSAVGELVPTYPSGLPLTIAPVRLLAGELAAYLVVPVLGAIAVLCTYALGARLHSRPAGVAAAALLATSPVFLFQLVQPMSDVAVTAWWALAFYLALSPSPVSPLAAGAIAGLAVLTRPNLAPLAAVVALPVINWPRLRRMPDNAASARQARVRRMPDNAASARQARLRQTPDDAASAAQVCGGVERRLRPQRILPFAAGITPAFVTLAFMQWRLYGNPLTSGYGSAGELFAVGNIAPNLVAYGVRILHGEGAALGIATFALAMLVARRTRGEERKPFKRALTLATLAAAIVVASYLPYAVFAEWSYLRFLLPAFPLLFALIGALLVTALLRLPTPARGIVFAATITLACSLNILRAEQEQAFNLRRYESRYRLGGRYLAAALPREAVIVAVQESGSARYYVDVPILRWDLLDVDLDTALAAMRAIGRYPVLLVEDWEAPDLRKKFPSSANARLDWPARAEFGDETRVRLFDPLDRGTPRPWAADRVH